MLPVIHEMRNQGNDHFVCHACGYQGNLAQAVEHTIKNQFVVVESEERKEDDAKW
jgi:hypothetical protein